MTTMHVAEAGLIHALTPDVRRCYDRKEAASYVGVSPNSFDKLVRRGIMPRPTKLLGRKVWDRRALDRVLDGLTGIDSRRTDDIVGNRGQESPLEIWRRTNGKS
jgi:predicted DNA-binding transcriptional regulator AlpA